MCGRFGAWYRDIKTVWNLHGNFAFQKRYNIAPSQEVPVIVRNEGRNEAKVMKWGLVPSWAPDPSMGQRMINARSETLLESRHSSTPCRNGAAWFRRMAFMNGGAMASAKCRCGFNSTASPLRFLDCGTAG
jgi:putative SOS response-associated peptidase YedK